MLSRRDEGSSAPPAAEIEALLGARADLFARIDALAPAAVGEPRIRIHGDLHLGQVLVAGGDVMFIDFEGEPTKPLEVRRAKASPMRDLAGLLRSLDYAAARALDSAPPESKADTRAEALLAPFASLATEAIVGGYLEAGGRISEPLLELFLIEKAAYEIAYEAANRPDWLATPVRGLHALARIAESAA